MKKFKFTLQTLLKKEKLDERKRLGDLGEIRSILMKAVDIKEGIDADIDKARRNAKCEGETTIEKLKEFNLFMSELMDKRRKAEESIGEIRDEEKRRLDLVRETQKNIKGLEKLREKQYLEHMDRIKKLEEKSVEEYVSQTYIRERV